MAITCGIVGLPNVGKSTLFNALTAAEIAALASGDGVVGVTPGLTVEVRDAAGTLVATLDVGQGYSPGDELELPDGVRVSFGAGELSATHGDVFELDVVVDGDGEVTEAAVVMADDPPRVRGITGCSPGCAEATACPPLPSPMRIRSPG